MDESFHPKTNVSSLTGIVVPVDRYSEIRDGFYALLTPMIQPREGTVYPAPELHGCEFLPEQSDETKLAVLRGITALAVQCGLRIYRIGYFITPDIEKAFPQDKRLLGICFHSLLSMMHTILEEETVIPVMDGFERKTIDHFSSSVKFLDQGRAVGLGKHLSLRFTENLLGEVFYADSAHCAPIQIADCIAYLRNASDLRALGFELTPFKDQLCEISGALQPCILWEEIISFVLNGQPQGPKEKVHAPYAENGPLTASFVITPSDTAV